MSRWFFCNKEEDEELLIDISTDDENDTAKTNGFFQDLSTNRVWNDLSTKVVKSGTLNNIFYSILIIDIRNV